MARNAKAIEVIPVLTDEEKGRKPLDEMTADEKLTEILAISRATQDLVEKFMNDLPNNPMFSMLGKFFS